MYNSGLDYLFQRNYINAIEEFERVESNYPYSVWVRHSLLMAGFTHYLINQYEEALSFIDRFISLYPGNTHISYAYYLRAMCYYEQISEYNRESSKALLAKQAFEQLVGFFPQSNYAKDALLKLDLINAVLAAREIYLGRWAMERAQFSSALNRFRNIIIQYNQTAYTPEALHRMVETYLTIGLDDEARRHAAILRFNYPESQWYDYSHQQLDRLGLAQ